MARHRAYSIDFKRQVAQEFFAGEGPGCIPAGRLQSVGLGRASEHHHLGVQYHGPIGSDHRYGSLVTLTESVRLMFSSAVSKGRVES